MKEKLSLVIKFITNKWFVAIIAFSILAFIIHVLGPLIQVGETQPWIEPLHRWLTVAVIALIWLGKQLTQLILQKKNDDNLAKDLIENSDNVEEEQQDAEHQQLQSRFSEAISYIRKDSKWNRPTSLYKMPWYIIIGPPGSGKTTALTNSGLKFPLQNQFGDNAIQGLGGTRNCDWWFTEQAVLIDTAGRFMTQDSEKTQDKNGWNSFLNLLKKYRKRRPINGAFVTISATDLLFQTPAETNKLIQTTKQRVAELRTRLGIEFPVYLMLTKCDLINGFSTCFSDMGQPDREQVFGFTFPRSSQASGKPTAFESGLKPDTPSYTGQFAKEYETLLARLKTRVLYRIHQEQDSTRCANINLFFHQLNLLKPRLQEFIDEVFNHTSYDEKVLLRGVYLTSGTQDSNPFDRLVNQFSSSPATSPDQLSLNKPTHYEAVKGKSFFIRNLLEKVAFAESDLAGTDSALEKQLVFMRRSAFTLLAVTTICILAAWGISYYNNKNYIESVAQQLKDADSLIEKLSPYDLDPASAQAVLDSLVNINQQADKNLLTRWTMHMGLFQGDKIGEQVDQTYRKVLRKVLLSRLILQIESRLKTHDLSQSYRYATLRNYLMLDNSEHFSGDEVNAFVRLDWLDPQARRLSSEQYESLSQHIDNLFSRFPNQLPIPLDHSLVEESRLILASSPINDRVYGRLQQLDYSDVKPFSVFNAAGKGNAELIFTRTSGNPLTEPLPPMFTKSAWQQAVDSDIDRLTDEVLMESWVYGQSGSSNSEQSRKQIVRRVKQQYLNDYLDAYKTLLSDIDLVPFTSFDDANRLLSLLISEDSPLLLLLAAIKSQTELTESNNNIDIASKTVKAAQTKLQQYLGKVNSSRFSNPVDNLDRVTYNFQGLHNLITSTEDAPLPIQALLEQIALLQQYMNLATLEASAGSLPIHLAKQGQSLIQQLRLTAESQHPILMRQLLTTAAERSSSLAFGGVVIHLNQLWQEENFDFCRTAIAGRYPFNKRALSNVQLNDFGRFFGYGGMMESYFNTHLKAFVDTSRSPWKLKKDQTTPVAISGKALKAFEMADRIKKSYFKPGSDIPSLNFTMTPLKMDSELSAFNLNLEGQSVFYDFGPQLTQQLSWPGPNPDSEVSLEMRDLENEISLIREQGPWAWFRLLDKARIKKTRNTESFEVTLEAGGHHATYALNAASSYNPFKTKTINFQCPKTL